MKRTALRRRTQLAPMSTKRRRLIRARAEVRRQVLERDRGCVASGLVLDVTCSGRVDVHEILSRARGGSILDLENCVSLCRAHHDWTHGHPTEATALGLLRSREPGE